MSNPITSLIDFKTKKRINACVRDTLSSLEHENTVIANTPNGILQRVKKVYTGIKPLFTFLSTFPILPQTWRTGITVLGQVLDALVAVVPETTLQFKAGKDLEEAA